MPFVNKGYGQIISRDEHFFINYNEFINTYAIRDSVYCENIDNLEFLHKNPDLILPNSVFVFVTKKSVENINYDLQTPKEVSDIVVSQIELLKARGRTIRLYYDDDILSVYEIINKDKSSKLNDLIFNL